MLEDCFYLRWEVWEVNLSFDCVDNGRMAGETFVRLRFY